MIYYIDGWEIKTDDGWTIHPIDTEVLEFKQPGEITQYKYKPDWSTDRGELVRLLKERRAEEISVLRHELNKLAMLVIE